MEETPKDYIFDIWVKYKYYVTMNLIRLIYNRLNPRLNTVNRFAIQVCVLACTPSMIGLRPWLLGLIYIYIYLTPLSNSKWKIDGTLSLDKFENILILQWT